MTSKPASRSLASPRETQPAVPPKEVTPTSGAAFASARSRPIQPRAVAAAAWAGLSMMARGIRFRGRAPAEELPRGAVGPAGGVHQAGERPRPPESLAAEAGLGLFAVQGDEEGHDG